MRTALIIPARYGSTRMPGKPLVLIAGQTMLQRVVRIAQAAARQYPNVEVIVATDDARISRLAEELGVDRSHLCRTFRARVGVPPSEYLQRIRMQTVFSLLKSADDDIAAIAAMVGIDNPAYFSRIVSAPTGVPPRTLRSTLR